MEEQTTWKGHTFTLLVFTGIVVLCSIFFILGMLVGRAEGQKLAGTGPGSPAAKNETKAAPKEDKQDLSFYESLKKEEPPVLQPAPAKPRPAPEPLPLEQPKKAEPEPEPAAASSAPSPAPANSVYYQIGAVTKSEDAERLLQEVKKKGFPHALILSPPEGDPKPLFKVQVGPFADLLDAHDVEQKLKDAGYKPLPKK
jgi:cell division septation protein DedD